MLYRLKRNAGLALDQQKKRAKAGSQAGMLSAAKLSADVAVPAGGVIMPTACRLGYVNSILRARIYARHYR